MIPHRKGRAPDGGVPLRVRPLRRLFKRFVSADSYGLVLMLVVITYVVSVSFETGWAQWVVVAIQFVTVWLTFRTAGATLSARVVLPIAVAAVALVTLVEAFLPVAAPALAAAFVVSSLLYVAAPFAIVRDVATRRTVDQETVLGAIAGYLIVGMCFAFTFRAIGAVQPVPFFGAAGTGDMGDALFFSFTTLTTTGYGNLVPATNPGQSLAVMEALLGQLFLVTAVAKIVTAWRPRRWQRPEKPE